MLRLDFLTHRALLDLEARRFGRLEVRRERCEEVAPGF
jgi:hypothetical protein